MLKKMLGCALASVFILSVSSLALEVRTGDSIEISEGTVIEDNVFAAGEKVTISGEIKGDLIAFGRKVKIMGTIEGHVIAGGGEIEMSGSAENVFMGGGEVSMGGVARKDLLVGSGMFSLDENARIGKDAFLGCGKAKLSGKIYRDLKAGVGNLVIGPSAMIKGKLDYSAQDFCISDQAKILGDIASYARPAFEKKAKAFYTGFISLHKIISFFTILLLGALAIIFFPNQVKLVTSKMTAEFWKSLGWGILSLLVIPLVVTLFLFTVIGIPLGILLLIAYIFGIYIAGIFTSIVMGRCVLDKLGRSTASLIWALFLGLIIFKLITWIPVAGWIIGLIFLFWAFGALVSTRFVYYKEAREKEVL